VIARSTLVPSSLVIASLLALAGTAFAGGADRLDRFRMLAEARLAVAQITDEAATEDAYREIYALLDDEIVESLASGGVFASLGFLQDRFDAVSEAWGATVVRVMRAGPLTVGAFQLSDAPAGNSVRIYGRLRDEAALLGTLARPGRPRLHALPADGRGAHFLTVWEGALAPHGTRALRIDHVRQHGEGVRVAWSTADVFDDGLFARAWSVRGRDIVVSYEVRYPGWTPGCDGQTEHEDVYRLTPGGTFSRIARRHTNAWHRDFHASVARLYAAISAGDRTALSGLVPDAALRGQLPSTLRPEPACDATETGRPDRVSVAASAERGPWQLTWERRSGVWRLVQAAPVIP
jgi:hypothetical protein